jgi:nucleoside-diphosphate-sugar epimerase
MTAGRQQPAQFLVTGATGFIGRRVVRRLLAGYGAHAVICLVKPPIAPPEAAALESFRTDGLQLIEGELMRPSVADRPAPKVDVVFHLAANIDTNAPEAELLVNHVGTAHLLDWLRPVSAGSRIIYASSVAVHDRDRQPIGPIDERSPFVARTAYGRTKRLGEDIIRERSSAEGYSWTILRLPTVYGPGQKPGGLFDQLIQLASTGALLGRIDWPGRTSIIHVDDVAAVMIDLSQRADAAGEIYCIASESPTVAELSARIAKAIKRPRSPISIPRPALGLLRWLVWNKTGDRFIPPAARLAFWRLSLIVSDGFWFDTAKFRRAYDKPLRTLEEGLPEILPSTRLL